MSPLNAAWIQSPLDHQLVPYVILRVSGAGGRGSELRADLSRNYPANYDAHARSVASDAYWQQVRRTVNGKPINETQIDLIVNAIGAGLSLTKEDVVLDLACGNGALSSYLFDKCAGLLGIDISPYLIEVAQSVFARLPDYRFEVDEIVSFLGDKSNTDVFTKVLIYAGFQYFSRVDTLTILKALNDRFSAVKKVFIGNVPNKARADQFLRDGVLPESELNDHEARIGIWYLPEELEALANAAGWRATCSYMPADFYLSSHRFDITLERPGV